MNILIVEDTEAKRSAIESTLRAVAEEIVIESALSVMSALSKMREREFDLIVLDVVIPFEDGDEDPRPENCCRLIQLISATFTYSPFFVLLTAQIDRYREVSADLNRFGWSTIEYADDDSWHRPLTNVAATVQKSSSIKYGCDIVWVVALRDSEFVAVRELNLNWKQITIEEDPSIYYEGYTEVKGARKTIVLGCAVSMGQVHAAEITSRMIRNFRPKMIVMTGITGGVKNKCNLGDIVIAKSVFDYGSGKILDGREGSYLEPAPNDIPCDYGMAEKVNLFLDGENWRDEISAIDLDGGDNPIPEVHFAPIASGANVIGSKKVVAEIVKRNRKAVGIEMESYAVFHACRAAIYPHRPAFVCKSVTDFADVHKGDKFRMWASRASAVFALQFIRFWLS